MFHKNVFPITPESIADPVHETETVPTNDSVDSKRKVVFITGLSGAGKTSTLHILEDLYFETVDNLPLFLLKDYVFPPNKKDKSTKPLGVSIDFRSRNFDISIFLKYIHDLKQIPKLHIILLFFDCETDILVKRFNIVRRFHPLSSASRPMYELIVIERNLMYPLREISDFVIDTSHLTIPNLRNLLKQQLKTQNSSKLIPQIISFSYKKGIPENADNIFDVRFFENPFYHEDLRQLTGLDVRIANQLMQDSGYSDFFQFLKGFLYLSIPRYEKEGKRYISIAFGCTGGQHRSIFWAEQAKDILVAMQYDPLVFHRELSVKDD